jgi:hypothetical protein
MSEMPAVGELQPTFYVETTVDVPATRLAGCEILRHIEMVRLEMHSPQRGFFSLTKHVTDEHRQRWPQEYAEFRAEIAQGLLDDPVAALVEADDDPAAWQRAYAGLVGEFRELAARVDRLERTVIATSGRPLSREADWPNQVSMLPRGGPVVPERPRSALDAFVRMPLSRVRRQPGGRRTGEAELPLDEAPGANPATAGDRDGGTKRLPPEDLPEVGREEVEAEAPIDGAELGLVTTLTLESQEEAGP